MLKNIRLLEKKKENQIKTLAVIWFFNHVIYKNKCIAHNKGIH